MEGIQASTKRHFGLHDKLATTCLRRVSCDEGPVWYGAGIMGSMEEGMEIRKDDVSCPDD